MSKKSTLSKKQVGLKYGFRSGLEERFASILEHLGVDFLYEKTKLKYLKPAKCCVYTPDFHIKLPNGKELFIETKGRFTTADRMKHLYIRESHPEVDIRFVFQQDQRICKGSKTKYSDWCKKHGFEYAFQSIPKEWLK